MSGRIWVPHGNVGADVMVEGGSVVVVEVVTVVEDDAAEDEDNDNDDDDDHDDDDDDDDDDECDVDVLCVVVELTEGTGASRFVNTLIFTRRQNAGSLQMQRYRLTVGTRPVTS